MKYKIAVIGLKGLPAFGGAAAVGENIITQLEGQYDFFVYSVSSHTSSKSGILSGYTQIVLKKIPIRKLNILYYYIFSAIHAVFIGKYDLIHIHHRDAVFILPFLRLKYKVLLTTHGFVLTEKWSAFGSIFSLQDKLFLRFANIITCVSLKDLNIVRKYKVSNVFHIPNGILLDKNPKKEKTGEFIFFAAGRIVPSKGCHIFLNALNIIGYKGKIVIAGDLNQIRDYNKKLIILAEKLDVTFTGLIKDRIQLNELILNSIFFVFPSRIESMSMMLLEVVSHKVPVLCSNIKENKDIFDDSEVLYFETDNEQELSEKLLWALKNIESMKKKAEKAYDKLASSYELGEITLRYAEFYQQLINKK